MKRTLIALFATMFVASAASAAPQFVLDTDSATYLQTQQITVTVTMTNVGAQAVGAFQSLAYQVGWNSAVASVTNVGVLSAFGNSSQAPILPGLNGSTTPACANTLNTCTLITQAAGIAGGNIADGAIVVGTLIMTANNLGLLNLSTAALGSLGGSVTIGANAAVAEVIVPEPTTAALLGLGLLGLGIAGRRR